MAERGKRDMSAQTIISLAKALDMSTDFLLTGRCLKEDVMILNQKASDLAPHQYVFLENLVKDFIQMCKNNPS
jgi:transcriptional regulator with XRE-family HTH domain